MNDPARIHRSWVIKRASRNEIWEQSRATYLTRLSSSRDCSSKDQSAVNPVSYLSPGTGCSWGERWALPTGISTDLSLVPPVSPAKAIPVVLCTPLVQGKFISVYTGWKERIWWLWEDGDAVLWWKRMFGSLAAHIFQSRWNSISSCDVERPQAKERLMQPGDCLPSRLSQIFTIK